MNPMTFWETARTVVAVATTVLAIAAAFIDMMTGRGPQALSSLFKMA